jgi:hypothetical protein
MEAIRMQSKLRNDDMATTDAQYDAVRTSCRAVFAAKAGDYGTAWQILRATSLTDQLFIKAQRIRTLEEGGESRVGEGIEDEFIGLVNYSLMALISLESKGRATLSVEAALKEYDDHFQAAKALMERKNHDYGEAWRTMRVSSFTDLILMKLLRIKHIESNDGKTAVSEGLDANYLDIVNYAVFALIKLSEVDD